MEDHKPLPRGQRSILLVEDSRVEAEVLRRTLAGGGYRVCVAHDGRQALEMARLDRPDLIMSDIRMPVMNGYELCRAVKGDPELAHVPVILLSVLSEPDDIIEAINAGADSYTTKPYIEADLLWRINSLLSDPARRRFEPKEAMEVEYRGRTHRIACDPQQMLHLLLSVYENTLMQNRELRAAQAELSALNERLEEKVRERTEAILRLNAELERRVEARTAELQAANTDLESFTSAVSHDLRAPLRAMGGFSAILAQQYAGILDDQGRSLLSHICEGAQHMGELIDGLLVLARSTRGEIRNDVVDLSALARRILEELARTDPDRKVTWDVEEGLAARGDARMLEALLTNLLTNAWKYTAKIPEPSIRFYAEDREGVPYYCVADNGAGFDMAYAGRLFQPFQRLHRQDQFPGLGIGLATVKRIVDRHGGCIDARSAPGRGAVFSFALPGPGAAG